ncbi:MAG: antitoxin [Jatrophihabitans sp.]|nr:MAG: antitoxin [Jatrophihabitans sp.]
MDFDDLKNKAENLAQEHSDQVDSAIDKAANLVGDKLGHADQVDAAAQKLKDEISGGGDAPQQ